MFASIIESTLRSQVRTERGTGSRRRKDLGPPWWLSKIIEWVTPPREGILPIVRLPRQIFMPERLSRVHFRRVCYRISANEFDVSGVGYRRRHASLDRGRLRQ